MIFLHNDFDYHSHSILFYNTLYQTPCQEMFINFSKKKMGDIITASQVNYANFLPKAHSLPMLQDF